MQLVPTWMKVTRPDDTLGEDLFVGLGLPPLASKECFFLMDDGHPPSHCRSFMHKLRRVCRLKKRPISALMTTGIAWQHLVAFLSWKYFTSRLKSHQISHSRHLFRPFIACLSFPPLYLPLHYSIHFVSYL